MKLLQVLARDSNCFIYLWWSVLVLGNASATKYAKPGPHPLQKARMHPTGFCIVAANEHIRLPMKTESFEAR